MGTLNEFLRGATAMGYLTAGLFFLRFYTRIGDRLFLLFAAAFALMGGIRITMVYVDDPMENQVLYWVRFLAYLIILGAIVDKNLFRRLREPGGKEDETARLRS